eukprot:3311741-Rhodomonas_salina.9
MPGTDEAMLLPGAVVSPPIAIAPPRLSPTVAAEAEVGCSWLSYESDRRSPEEEEEGRGTQEEREE